MRRSSLFLAGLCTLAGCAATSGEEATQEAAFAECPSTDPAITAALATVTSVAETCADVPPPAEEAVRPFAGYWSSVIANTPAQHRGRDAFFTPGEPQWVLGKFAYGLDLDLVGEEVDIFVLRGCAGAWEKLGTARTTGTGEHAPVEGVDDGGGRVFFPIPRSAELPIGRHRIRMVVAGDRTVTEQFIEVLPKGTPFFVSDVDGTLTERRATDVAIACDEESEYPAIWRAMVGGETHATLHEGAAETFRQLAASGYRPFYLTARPEFLVNRTRAFLREGSRQDGKGNLPQGLVHTTLNLTGAIFGGAADFKKAEIARLVQKGFKVEFGFGNRTTDIEAYRANDVPFRFYYQNADTWLRACSEITELPLMAGTTLVPGDHRIGSFTPVHAALANVPHVCR